MLLPSLASASNPPQCYNPLSPGAVFDCNNNKQDAFPANDNSGQFLPDHCYTLKFTEADGYAYFDNEPPCTALPFSAGLAPSGPVTTSTNGNCESKGSFFGFPTWYKYLKGDVQFISPDNKVLDPVVDDVTAPGVTKTCTPHLEGLNDVWLIVAAVIEILLRVASLAAIAMVVWGGIQYITSQGEPDRTTKARSTIVNALIGLVIAVGAATLVSFVAGRFH